MAEKLTLQQAFMQGRTVYGNQRFLGPQAIPVQSPGYQLFTGSGFTLDQYRRHGRRHIPKRLKDLLHLGTLTDKILLTDRFPDSLPQDPVLPEKFSFFMNPGNDDLKFIDINRLDQIIISSSLHRRNRIIDRSLSGNHDDIQIRVQNPGPL